MGLHPPHLISIYTIQVKKSDKFSLKTLQSWDFSTKQNQILHSLWGAVSHRPPASEIQY